METLVLKGRIVEEKLRWFTYDQIIYAVHEICYLGTTLGNTGG
jgi:hypothetical protein